MLTGRHQSGAVAEAREERFAILDLLECTHWSAPTPQTSSHCADAVGSNDLLIAAQAVALDYAIVTDNEREFARIDDLPRENWLREA